MKCLIEAFERAYIINLRDRPDRRRDVCAEFKKIGFSEVPNEHLHFYSAVRPNDKGKFHSIGARGVFTSHKKVLELALEANLRNVIVFEDDVAFRSIPDKHISKILSQLSSTGWDLIFFGYTFPSDEQLGEGLIPWPKQTLGTHFYAVNGPFFGRMLEYMRACEAGPIGDPEQGPTSADGIYNRVRLLDPSIRVFLVVPTCAFQRSSRTDLQPLAIYDRMHSLESVIRMARSVKHGLRMTLDRFKLWQRLRQ